MNDVNNLDPNDEGLKAVMGSKFQDVSGIQKPVAKKSAPAAKSGKTPCRKAVDASWAPVKVAPTEIERIMDCAKQAVLYGSVSALLFWWQQAGWLASEAAVPSFIVIALLAGLKIGGRMARG